MFFRRSLVLSLVILSVALTSCKKENRPADMPEIYPVSVKVIQAGAPLAGATVTLFSDDPSLMRWPVGGETNDSGVAELRTMGFLGAPAGKFRVAVQKIETTNRATSYEEAQKNQEAGLEEEQFDLVAPQFTENLSTPLSIEIQASKSNPVAEFDVGEPVRNARDAKDVFK